MVPTIEDRLLRKAVRDGDCLIWTGASNLSKGGQRYGCIAYEGKNRGAHVVAHLVWVGPVAKGQHVHHRCERTLCIEPKHLQAVSPRENLMASDTPAARNAAKTHCWRGHEFTPENTYVKTHERFKGDRVCRACQRIDKNARRARRRDAGLPYQ